MTDAADRFVEMIDFTNDCWLWAGLTNDSGYGLFRCGAQRYRAHRWAWEWAVGPIPEGLEIDHICRVRACVNPDHLEPVTRQENMRRMGEAFDHPAFCKHGHQMDESNVYRPPGRPSRHACRECTRRRIREYKARLKACR